MILCVISSCSRVAQKDGGRESGEALTNTLIKVIEELGGHGKFEIVLINVL